MIIIIDNYDSFTYNVYQALAKITTEEIRVLRSRECTIADIEKLNPSRLIVSPGPGRPEDAGISVEAIKHFAGKLPILGVCLGHQAIGYAFGAKIVQAKFIKHGIAEEIDLDGKGLFRTIGKKNIFTRYHSLVIDESTLPGDFEVTARATDGDIMGIRHPSRTARYPRNPEHAYCRQGFDSRNRRNVHGRLDGRYHGRTPDGSNPYRTFATARVAST